jgi:hypothetical protein
VSGGDDSALYLFHVKGDELNVWLCTDTGMWVLKDTVSVKETCINFITKEYKLIKKIQKPLVKFTILQSSLIIVE